MIIKPLLHHLIVY